MSGSSVWQPALDGSDADRARSVVLRIANRLRIEGPEASRSCLLTGFAGAALLPAYLDAIQPNEGWSKVADDALRQATALARSGLDYSLWQGVTGVAWTIAHVNHLREKETSERALQQVDELLEARLKAPWEGDFDIVLGLAGIGVYAREHLPSPVSWRLLTLTVDRLSDQVEFTGERATWRKPDNRTRRDGAGRRIGRYDVGMAHGTAGIVAFLAAANDVGLDHPALRPMLEGAVMWLLDHAEPRDAEARFPHFVSPPGGQVSRTAWCYGDPGVALALSAAASTLKREDWCEEAAATSLAIARRPQENSGVIDPGLCHGAAGVAHCLARLYQRNRKEEVRSAARVWYRRALDMLETPLSDRSFSLGELGSALALLAATSEQDPGWDQVLLAS